MNENYRSIERRARRSLRWYPVTWRRRFGDEFVALMEDDLAEHPRSRARTVNLIKAGLSARFVDLGVVGQTIDPTRQTQVGFATTLLISLWFLSATAGIWAGSMLGWNGGIPYHPTTWAITITTALMTVSLWALSIVLCLAVLALLVSAVVPIVRGTDRRLLAPVFGVVAGSGWLLIAQHILLRYTIASGGIQWSYAGTAIKQLAGATSDLVSQIGSAVVHPSAHNASAIIAITMPFAIAIVSLSTMSIVRRLQWPQSLRQISHFIMVGQLALIIAFVVSTLLWTLVGGLPMSIGIGGPSRLIELGAAGLLSISCGSCVLRSKQRLTATQR